MIYSLLDYLQNIQNLKIDSIYKKTAKQIILHLNSLFGLVPIRAEGTADNDFVVVYKIQRFVRFLKIFNKVIKDELYIEIYKDGSCIVLIHHYYKTVDKHMYEMDFYDKGKVEEILNSYYE